METDYTRKFSIHYDKDPEIKKVLTSVYSSLQEKGYNPINQIVGYILSEDPTYITNYNNARAVALYECCGFVTCGLLPDAYRAEGESRAVQIMVKRL